MPTTREMTLEEFAAAVALKSDIRKIVESDTLIDLTLDDLVALAKGLARKGWSKHADDK